jgi:hypothetical protein
MSTKKWLNAHEYDRFFHIAQRQPDILYFDERCWNATEVFEFFDTLKYGDYETYARVIRRFPEYRRTDFRAILKANKDCEQRYMKWKREQTPEFLKWQE